MDAVTINGLKVSFSNKTVLSIEDLTICAETVTVITGPSGGGKSTLLRSINRLNDCFDICKTEGRVMVRLDGALHDNRHYPPEKLRRKIGMVFQHPNVLPVSIEKNFTLPLGIKRAQALDIMEKQMRETGLWDEVKDRLRENAAALSGGQQQRLCLARALALEPEILLLDEPTSSLDSAAAERIEELVLKLAGKLTVIAVTHSEQQAQKLGTAFIEINDVNRLS